MRGKRSKPRQRHKPRQRRRNSCDRCWMRMVSSKPRRNTIRTPWRCRQQRRRPRRPRLPYFARIARSRFATVKCTRSPLSNQPQWRRLNLRTSLTFQACQLPYSTERGATLIRRQAGRTTWRELFLRRSLKRLCMRANAIRTSTRMAAAVDFSSGMEPVLGRGVRLRVPSSTMFARVDGAPFGSPSPRHSTMMLNAISPISAVRTFLSMRSTSCLMGRSTSRKLAMASCFAPTSR
mmetsp:Transcript_9364/g.28395  ORF Transcript_9364/g.28395 Transcript_9364/m.28395 type:complete len:235 (-) Transcript_9364:3378-4082(-)